MKRQPRTSLARDVVATGAGATGAQAIGATALGALSLGAFAVGAMAVGALAIGRLAVGRARLGRVEIGRLTVGRLDIGLGDRGVTAVIRLRAAPGQGDAMARLLLDERPAGGRTRAGALFDCPRRSAADPDLFLLSAHFADAAAFEEEAGSPPLDALRRRLVDAGLATGADDGIEVELYRPVG